MTYTREEKGAMLEELHEYIRKHPTIPGNVFPDKHRNTLQREYGGRITEARRNAGVPERPGKEAPKHPQRKDTGLEEDLRQFRNYLDAVYGEGGSVTKTDLDGTRWISLLGKYRGSINALKEAAGRPEYVHTSKRGRRHAHRKSEISPYHRRTYRPFGRR